MKPWYFSLYFLLSPIVIRNNFNFRNSTVHWNHGNLNLKKYFIRCEAKEKKKIEKRHNR